MLLRNFASRALPVLILLLVAGACRQAPEPEPGEPDPAWSASLAFDRAAAFDLITVLTPAGGAAETVVLLDGTQLPDTEAAADGLSLTFDLPVMQPGPYPVLLQHGDDQVETELTVLPSADVQELMLVLSPALQLAELNEILASYGVEPVTDLRQLYTPGAGTEAFSDCVGQLALIQVPPGHPSVGQLLAELQQEEQVWAADPKSEWGLSSVTPVELAGGTGLRQLLPNFDGSGVTIAVLDTGVASVSRLGSRRLPQIDVLGDGETGDPYRDASGDPVGHGTAVAALAAGQDLGLATGAEVLPIRVCDADGLCLASDVLLGVCSALAHVPPEDGLVLNLSLGGDSEARILSLLLAEAAERGAVIVAAAGNEAGAPPHWPAAGSTDNPGLVAAGALSVTGVEADLTGLPVGMLVADTVYPLDGFAEFRTGEDPDFTVMVAHDPVPSITVAGTSLAVNPTVPAAALRLLFALPAGSRLPDIQFESDGHVLTLETDSLPGTPLLQDGILVQALPSAAGTLELLIDPLPADFEISTDQNSSATILELELLRVTPAPGGYTSGAYVSLSAPADQLVSVNPAGALQTGYTGTSFATPQLAGAAALQLQLQAEELGQPDAALVRDALIAGVQPVSGDPLLVGAGRLDLRQLYPTSP